MINDKQVIAFTFNSFFAEIGLQISANLPNPIFRPEFFFDKTSFQTNVNFEFYEVDVHAWEYITTHDRRLVVSYPTNLG